MVERAHGRRLIPQFQQERAVAERFKMGEPILWEKPIFAILLFILFIATKVTVSKTFPTVVVRSHIDTQMHENADNFKKLVFWRSKVTGISEKSLWMAYHSLLNPRKEHSHWVRVCAIAHRQLSSESEPELHQWQRAGHFPETMWSAFPLIPKWTISTIAVTHSTKGTYQGQNVSVLRMGPYRQLHYRAGFYRFGHFESNNTDCLNGDWWSA